jgi:tRNA(fMet)-specific endonuclease VapC
MNGKLVDTNVIIRVLKGQTELFSLFDDMEKLFVSSISIGELMYGAELSKKLDFNKELYFDFCNQMKIIYVDSDIAKNYGKIKAQLKKSGHPIPENDIWIAATAIAANLTLVTADSDFDNIEGLIIEKL